MLARQPPCPAGDRPGKSPLEGRRSFPPHPLPGCDQHAENTQPRRQDSQSATLFILVLLWSILWGTSEKKSWLSFTFTFQACGPLHVGTNSRFVTTELAKRASLHVVSCECILPRSKVWMLLLGLPLSSWANFGEIKFQQKSRKGSRSFFSLKIDHFLFNMLPQKDQTFDQKIWIWGSGFFSSQISAFWLNMSLASPCGISLHTLLHADSLSGFVPPWVLWDKLPEPDNRPQAWNQGGEQWGYGPPFLGKFLLK
jgi:hypothetical protein